MPKSLPPEIAQFVEQHAPPGHRVAWVRCHLMKPPLEIERPPLKSQLLLGRKPPIDRDTVLELRDIDEGQGWDVRLVGTGHDIVMGDVFSALAHLPPGENQARKLAFLYNHKTGVYRRVYEDVSTAGTLLNELHYKRSLAFWEPATSVNRIAAFRAILKGYYISSLTPARHKLRNGVLTALAAAFVLLLLWLGPGGLGGAIAEETFLHPWLLVLVGPAGFALATVLAVLLMLPLVILGAFLFYLGVRLIRAIYEPPRFRADVEHSFAALIGFDNVVQAWRYCRVDETYLYEELGKRLHRYVQEHPDPKLRFVVGTMRGQGTKGVLAEDAASMGPVQAEPAPLTKAA